MELKYHRYNVPEIYVFSSYSTMEKQRPIRKQILQNATNDLHMLEFYMIKAMHHNIIVIQVSIQGIYIYNIHTLSEEELEYTKGVIRIGKLKKDRQHNGQKKKGNSVIYKTLHLKLK